MASMLLSYYLFSAFIVRYLSVKVILFWAVMLTGSILLGNLLFSRRHTKFIRTLYLMAAVLLLFYDAMVINGIQIEVVMAEILLSILTFCLIRKKLIQKER